MQKKSKPAELTTTPRSPAQAAVSTPRTIPQQTVQGDSSMGSAPSPAKQPSTTNQIIKRIESARNREAVINEYKKIVHGLGEEYKLWVGDNTQDLIELSHRIDSAKASLEKISLDYAKIEGIVEVVKKHEESFQTKSSLLEKKGGKFNKLMKLNFSELMSETPELKNELILTPTPRSALVPKEIRDSLVSRMSSTPAEIEADNQRRVMIAECLEKLEVSILEKDAQKGVGALSTLMDMETNHPDSFASFQTYGKYRDLRDSLFTALEDNLPVI